MEEKKKSWTERQKEVAAISNKVIAKGLYASEHEKKMEYKEEYREKDLDFVVTKFKFLRTEPAFIPILVKLSEKHEMTYYDTAFMMFCSFRAMQDPFEALTSIRFLDHFYPQFTVLRYMKSLKVSREISNRFETLSKVIVSEISKDYFYEMKFMRIVGLKVLQCFHEVNRIKKMGIRKKLAPNSKRILNLHKNRYS
jgi:hypothetical protein